MATSAFLRFDLEPSWYTYNFISVLSVKFVHCNWLYTVYDTTREKTILKLRVVLFFEVGN